MPATAAFPAEYRIDAQARTLTALTESLTRKHGGASVMDMGKYFAVFDEAEDLVFQVWMKDGSDGARDVARRRAHELRSQLNAEAELSPVSAAAAE